MRQLPQSLRRLMRIREKLKSKRPEFVRIDQWRYVRIEDSGWRNVRSLDNKIRRKWKGWPKPVEVGYRTPRAVRGLHPSGYLEAIVHNVKQLETLDPATHAVRVGGAVGRRKRMEIVKRAREMGFHVLNPGGHD